MVKSWIKLAPGPGLWRPQKSPFPAPRELFPGKRGWTRIRRLPSGFKAPPNDPRVAGTAAGSQVLRWTSGARHEPHFPGFSCENWHFPSKILTVSRCKSAKNRNPKKKNHCKISDFRSVDHKKLTRTQIGGCFLNRKVLSESILTPPTTSGSLFRGRNGIPKTAK